MSTNTQGTSVVPELAAELPAVRLGSSVTAVAAAAATPAAAAAVAAAAPLPPSPPAASASSSTSVAVSDLPSPPLRVSSSSSASSSGSTSFPLPSSPAPAPPLAAPKPPASSAPQDVFSGWNAIAKAEPSLEDEYPRVCALVRAPPLCVGSLALAVSDPTLPGKLHSLLGQSMKGTHGWIKDEVVTWLKRSDDSETCRMLVILGSPGTGKSVISAMLVDQLLNVGTGHSAASGPDLRLSSLAARLSTIVPGCGGATSEAVVEAPRERGDVGLFFGALLVEPEPTRATLAESGEEGRSGRRDALQAWHPHDLVVALFFSAAAFLADAWASVSTPLCDTFCLLAVVLFATTRGVVGERTNRVSMRAMQRWCGTAPQLVSFCCLLGEFAAAAHNEAAKAARRAPAPRLPTVGDQNHVRHLESVHCSTVNLIDSYGDGWTGDAALSFTSLVTGDIFISGLTLVAGTFSSHEVCFGCGCYFGQATPGDYPEENSWIVEDSSGATLVASEADAASESFCPVSSSCFSCAVGSASNSEGSACDPCPAGRYKDFIGVAVACTACGAGTYSEVAGSTTADSCFACAAGSFSPSGASSCVPTPDVAVLVSVSDALGFNFWDFSADSSTTMGDVCASAMVTCDDLYSKVIGIKITDNPYLQGKPLSAFAVLSGLGGLEKLKLYGNGLTGRLPEQWGAEMSNMKYLDLCPNAIEGELPSAWAGMENLETLYLCENSLSGYLPREWAALVKLDELWLNSNSLSGSLPREWASLVKLKSLHLDINSLTGCLPSEWSSLIDLQKLVLDTNLLTGNLPREWKSLVRLQRLYLHSNSFSGYLPSEWESLASLEDLLLDSNSLTGELPDAWESLVSLQTLSLSFNSFTGHLPKSWASMANLQLLQLNSNLLAGDLPSEFESLVDLQTLALSNNSFTGHLPKSWASLVNLQQLQLNSNKLTGDLPKDFESLVNLEQLSLSFNKLTGDLPKAWATLAELQVLHLCSNMLTGDFPPELSSGLTALQSLDISSNAMTGGLEHMLSIPTLQSLNASDNLFAGPLSFIGGAGDSLKLLVISGNLFDHNVFPADFAVSEGNRAEPLVVDVRRVDFSCPFPTVGGIKDASEGMPPLVLCDRCHSDYGAFLLRYALPFLGGIVVMFCALKLLRRSKHQLAICVSKPLKKLDDEVTRTSHKRLKMIVSFSFGLMLYDICNDATVYKNMLAVVSSDSVENPCEVPNYRGAFYPDQLKWRFLVDEGSYYPDVLCDGGECRESGFINYAQYLGYIDDWVEQGNIQDYKRTLNVEAFASFCSSFYVVDGVQECAYSAETKGAEGCVRVKNMRQQKNHRVKKFIIASLTIVCLKEFAKLMLVLYIWMKASGRKLGPCELGLLAESPFLPLLWGRPNFLGELLLAPTSMNSRLLVFFFEDVCHSINLLSVVVYFALYVDQQGISFGIMQSLFTSSFSMLNTANKIANEWWKEVTDLPEAHIDDWSGDAVLVGQQQAEACATSASESAKCSGCFVGWWRSWGGGVDGVGDYGGAIAAALSPAGELNLSTPTTV